MAFSKIVSTAMKICHLTQLNTYLINQKGEMDYHVENVSIPSFMPGSNMEDPIDFFHRIDKEDELYAYINPWGLYYLGYSFLERGQINFIVVGPYLEVVPNIHSLSLKYSLSGHHSSDLRNFLEKVHILTEGQINSYAVVLKQFNAMRETEAYPSLIHANNHQTNKTPKNTVIDEKVDLINRRYRIEEDFMQAVKKGDKKAALKQISSDNMLFSFSERFPNQPLRRLKNLTTTLNTLLRIAARNGDVPAILIHRISEKFAYDIENGDNISTLHRIQDQMIEEYADLAKSNTLNMYSHMIRKAIEHLLSYYDQKINITQLALHCHTHPGNLSRKFKQETGMTITEYQQKLRVNQAKYLLKKKDLAIDEIAWIVGYDDSSYFGKIFKRATGDSPSKYRKKTI